MPRGLHAFRENLECFAEFPELHLVWRPEFLEIDLTWRLPSITSTMLAPWVPCWGPLCLWNGLATALGLPSFKHFQQFKVLLGTGFPNLGVQG